MHTKLIFSTVITFLLIPAIVFGLSRAALSQNNPINRDVNSRTTVVTPPPKLSTTISDQDYTLWKADGSQYCAYSDHTLEIEVDADPEDISDLSLIISAYDVDYRDESGDCEGGPEVDIVTINGNNLGNLVGANDSWSTTRFSVDPQLIMTGTNTVKIDTDATATDCWCVGIGYAALRGKVGDLQVMQVTPADKAVNVDWEQPDISAVFNVEIDPKSVDDTTVKLTDYWGQTTYSGTLSVGGNTIRFTPSPELPETGVRLKMTLKGGDSGIKGKGGAQLQQDYSWTFYTLPRLTVSIIPVQVVDDVNLVHNKPGVVRIKAVWDEFSDVDEVPVKITLSYSDGTSVTREPFVFYNEILTSVPAEYRRHGRSANFYSAKGEMPIITTPGTYTIKAVVEPAGQKVVPVKTFKADKSVAVNRYRIGYTSQTVNFRTRYVPLGLGGWTAGSTQDITAMAAASDRKLR
ncbi:MAG: Ig-like domain-containing protein, partial [Deltaproteobacteria bacterium]|nr:Ig-like domain-containing protein [Deltaproteobacteria bacterium]